MVNSTERLEERVDHNNPFETPKSESNIYEKFDQRIIGALGCTIASSEIIPPLVGTLYALSNKYHFGNYLTFEQMLILGTIVPNIALVNYMLKKK